MVTDSFALEPVNYEREAHRLLAENKRLQLQLNAFCGACVDLAKVNRAEVQALRRALEAFEQAS